MSMVINAEPHSLVSSIADFRTEGPWFDPGLCQCSFRGLMMVIATGFIPFSLLSIVLTIGRWESSQCLGKNIVQSTGLTLKLLNKQVELFTSRKSSPNIAISRLLRPYPEIM